MRLRPFAAKQEAVPQQILAACGLLSEPALPFLGTLRYRFCRTERMNLSGFLCPRMRRVRGLRPTP